MKPKTTPKKIGNEASSTNYKTNIKCPPNSVAIKRATKEDLIITESIKTLGLNKLTEDENRVDTQGHEYAMVLYERKTFGARGMVNVWSPVIEGQQFSLAGMTLAKGPPDQINIIQAGWLVHSVVSPNASRLFIFWTGDGYKTGCFNTMCPGFVQVSKEMPLGLYLRPSTYNDTQTEMLFDLYQDQVSKNWWLMIDGQFIGYWPKDIVPLMGDGADMVTWGGEVYSPKNVPSPAMGNGYFAEDVSTKAAYIRHIKVISVVQGSNNIGYDPPKKADLNLLINEPSCYTAVCMAPEYSPTEVYLYFGGPGKCTF